MLWPSSLRYAQVLSQPFFGSLGSLSPSRYGSPIMNTRPGPELAGRAYMKRLGFALAQASNSAAVLGGVFTLVGMYSMIGPAWQKTMQTPWFCARPCIALAPGR